MDISSFYDIIKKGDVMSPRVYHKRWRLFLLHFSERSKYFASNEAKIKEKDNRLTTNLNGYLF